MENKNLFKTATELALALKNRTTTCVKILNQLYAHIGSIDPKIHAFLHLFKQSAYEDAETIDALYEKGNPLPPLAGVPIAIKNNMCIKGEKTTCASKMLENFVSPYNATVINRLKQNKLILLGGTNLDEFAMGSSTENSAFGPTRNPWNTDYVPGGSSGGSAASVASGEAPIALGSDTGGSIRQPAALCGVIGMKPTYGRVSRYGLVAFASSLDQIGPLTTTVEDCAALLEIICGYDPKDATSSQKEVPCFSKVLGQDIKNIKVGVPTELFNSKLDEDVKSAIANALEVLRPEVSAISETNMDSLDYAVPSYYILAPAEASANLARFDGVRYGYRASDTKNIKELYFKSRGEGFGPEVKRRIILGTFVLSSGYYDAYYLKAQKVRTLIKKDFEKAFQKYDVLITPTSPVPAFKLGEYTDDPLKMYLSDIATIPVNLAGLPAISIPCGFSKEGLPIGLQLIAKPFAEETLLKVAHRFRQLTGFYPFPKV